MRDLRGNIAELKAVLQDIFHQVPQPNKRVLVIDCYNEALKLEARLLRGEYRPITRLDATDIRSIFR